MEDELGQFAEEAEWIARRLWDETMNPELPEELLLRLTDVLHNLRILQSQLYMYRQSRERVPCVLIDDKPVPIDVESMRGFPEVTRELGPDRSPSSWFPPDRSFSPHHFVEFLQDKHRIYSTTEDDRSGAKIVGVDPDDIGDVIRQPVGRFISNRLLGFFRSKSAASYAMQIHFTINTKTPNLVMYYAGAYFIQHHNYFGAPSTPVTSTIPAGLYCFGGDVAQGNLPRIEVQTRFNIPSVLQGHLATM